MALSIQPGRFGHSGKPDDAWLSKQEKEPILEPELAIIDTHHHLWDRGGWAYLLPELLADLNTGHNIIATVFEECRSMYRAGGLVESGPRPATRSSRRRRSSASNTGSTSTTCRVAPETRSAGANKTRGGRRRVSAAATYLRPANKRSNLRIATNALVHRVVFDGKRAVGVEFSRQSGIEHIDAAREVILSAGAIGSPHLLQLSGVGEPEVLKKAGIAVQHALPGVGQNFQDHYIARMSYYVRNLETLNERARGLGFANEIMRYLVQGKGMMTFGASLCAASVKVLPESATPDVQCVFAPASYRPGLIRKLDDRPGITGGPWQMRPLSRGYVLVRTPDPHDQPAINPRYLAEDTDQRAMVGGLKFLRRLFAAPALAPFIIEENVPGPSVQSDDELLDYARSNGSTVYHASCSCMMGNPGMSVVDDQLRVHGLEALRIIDASVMPAVSSTNTNAPTIMIAEKGAAMVKASAREKLAA